MTPFQKNARKCDASGQNFYSYGNASRGTGFDAPCPVCGKPVKLMRARGSSVKFPHVIPTHNAASPEQAEAPEVTLLRQQLADMTDDYYRLLREKQTRLVSEATQPTASNAATIQPWEERVKPDFPNTDPRTWKSGVSLGFVESHMKDEIDELRAALASKLPADDDCAGGSPCTNCPDKKQCQRGCIRQPEFIGQKSIAQDDCDTVDKLLSGLGLDPERCRTEGGALNVGRVLSLLQDGCASEPSAGEQKPVAYLDIGAGGYVDLGSDLSPEQLQALPFGRHALAIIGTFGVDGYTAAPLPEQVAQDSPPQGYAMVSLKQLAQWNEWVSLLAAYHLKADRHNVARRFVESINTIRAARAPGGEVKP